MRVGRGEVGSQWSGAGGGGSRGYVMMWRVWKPSQARGLTSLSCCPRSGRRGERWASLPPPFLPPPSTQVRQFYVSIQPPVGELMAPVFMSENEFKKEQGECALGGRGGAQPSTAQLQLTAMGGGVLSSSERGGGAAPRGLHSGSAGAGTLQPGCGESGHLAGPGTRGQHSSWGSIAGACRCTFPGRVALRGRSTGEW